MKDKIEINDQNYEDVMAGLLEQHFSDEEKEELLFDIARDPFLQFEWKQFQKCVVKEELQPYEIEEIAFWKSLQQKEEVLPVVKKRSKVIWFQFSIAASIALLAGFLYLLLQPEVHKQPTRGAIVKTNTKATEIMPPFKTEIAPMQQAPTTLIAKKQQPSPDRANATRVNTIPLEVLPETSDKIATKEPETEKTVIPQPKAVKRYSVHISSEQISESDFALLDDYDIMKVSDEDLSRINNTLKGRQTTLAQLLKNTTVQLKQKDNKIYLMASGDHQSTYILEIAN